MNPVRDYKKRYSGEYQKAAHGERTPEGMIFLRKRFRNSLRPKESFSAHNHNETQYYSQLSVSYL